MTLLSLQLNSCFADELELSSCVGLLKIRWLNLQLLGLCLLLLEEGGLSGSGWVEGGG